MGAEKKRLEILNSMMTAFTKAAEKDVAIDKSLLISELCMQYGVTKMKAEEYIQVLLDAKQIKEDLCGLWKVKHETNI